MKKVWNLLRKIFSLPKKFLIPGIIVLVLILLFVVRGSRSSVVPQLATAQSEDLKQDVSASGILTGTDSAILRFQGPGLLSFKNVSVGDSVTSGEVIAGLDTQQLSISLQQAKNTLASNQATLEKILDDTHLFQYGNGGFANVGTANETETQRMARINAQEAVNNSYDSVKAATAAFNNAVVTSPINGVVTLSDPLPGQNVGVTDTIAQIVNFSQIVFAADVDESDIAKVSLGQKAEVTLNSYGDKVFDGTVSEIEHLTRTTSNGATVVTVKVALHDSSIKPIQGLNGQVNIITAQKRGLAIPQTALLDNNTVLVKTSTGFEKRTITTGFQTDTETEITSGLADGDQVVTNPQDVAKTLNSGGPLSKIFRRS